MKSAEGRYVLVNREFASQVGMDADQIIGKTSAEVLPGELGLRFKARDEAVRVTRAPTLIESREILRGRARTFINRAFPLLDESGEVHAIVSIETDITALRDAESRLRESEKRFRAIFESAAVGIALYGSDRRLTAATRPTPRS